MRIYGWDDVGVARGEPQAAEVDAGTVRDQGPLRAAPPDWVAAYTRFGEAKAALIAEMQSEGSDPDDIDLVRSLRACDLR